MKTLSIATLCVFAGTQLFAAGFLHTDGGEIVDPDGNPVILRGIGLGGWLVPEGYQLKIPGFGSPSSIRKQITDLIGPVHAAEFYGEYEANYVNEADIRTIADWGFNSIRLPFNYRMLSPEDLPGVYLEEGFEVIDRVLDWCGRYNLYLILDMHCAPGGQNAGNISDSDGIEARLWTEPANQDRIVAIWRKIAERYAEETWIGGYDLINEPVLPAGHANAEIRALSIRIRDAVREVDDNHILFVEGNWYATDFSGLTPPFDDNMVYSFHKYWSENTAASIRPYLDIRERHGVPLWLGEFGENSNPWAADAIRLMEENRIGWNWWTHKKVATTTAPFSAPLPPDYQKVLDYWNGNAPGPDLFSARSALLEMAEGLKIENCTFLPDMLAALTRGDFLTAATPYRDHRIPGVIACEDYDIGGQGVAYWDRDYQQTRWDVSQPWNRGYTYRNDGVDIERSADPEGTPYNVGWIEDGEWLSYTVNADIPGEYEIRIRTASPQATGRLELSLSGIPVTPVLQIPSTGGWQNWASQTIRDVAVGEGAHRLTLSFPGGGFNLNQLEFILTRSHRSVPDGWARISDSAFLSPPHPNPFNDRTFCILRLEKPEPVDAAVWNAKGARVRVLAHGEMAAGEHRIVWDGTTKSLKPAASGIYLLKVEVDGDTASFKVVLVR
ncbi:MAG TPA: carbohydrate-binding protein [bacterium]|nr:carbohydrate-binding protein [bacterium]